MNEQQHVIDCDAEPFVPMKGWSVEEHRRGGSFVWKPGAVQLYLSELQPKGIVGHMLRRELASKPVLNANVLDWLLAHQTFIPENWKERTNDDTTYVNFWGTIYSDMTGAQYVRCLYWRIRLHVLPTYRYRRWESSYRWLDRHWRNNSPAALQVG